MCFIHAGRRGLEERLAAGESILCAEGYVLALTRMGYVAPGVWIPDFLIDRPEVLRNLYCQFADAGSDVIEAYQVRGGISKLFLEKLTSL